MAYIYRETVIAQDLPIFFNLNHHITSTTVNLEAIDFLADANGDKSVQAGMFVIKESATSTRGRLLPRTRLATASSTSAATATLGATWQTFKPNDVLFVTAPYTTITIGGTYLATEIVKVTIDGIVNNVVTGSTTNSIIATTVAAAISANALIGERVRAVTLGAVIYVFGKNAYDLYSVTTAARNAADDGGSASGTSTAAAAVLSFNTTAVGTVLTVVNGVLTLAANASVALPIGAPVGIRYAQLLGLYGHSIDFKNTPVRPVAPVIQATGVYESNLPYVDDSIKRQLSRLNIRIK